jgi:hypothetical protein
MGALLSSVKPEFLMSLQDFHRYIQIHIEAAVIYFTAVKYKDLVLIFDCRKQVTRGPQLMMSTLNMFENWRHLSP